MYEVIYSAAALKHLERLDYTTKKRIIAAIERIRVRPEDYVRKLFGLTYFRLRVGDYRVILDIQRKKLIIIVIQVGHRKNIYKMLK